MATKPIVDELQRRYAGRIQIVRVDLLTPSGRELAARYDFAVTPHFAGFNSRGSLVWTQRGRAPAPEMLDQLIP